MTVSLKHLVFQCSLWSEEAAFSLTARAHILRKPVLLLCPLSGKYGVIPSYFTVIVDKFIHSEDCVSVPIFVKF